jgi:hypothetical protein
VAFDVDFRQFVASSFIFQVEQSCRPGVDGHDFRAAVAFHLLESK